jgi:hypothetical protein
VNTAVVVTASDALIGPATCAAVPVKSTWTSVPATSMRVLSSTGSSVVPDASR